MVEATNYFYLAILVCFQYFGLQHESYQVKIDYSKIENFEKFDAVTVNLIKNGEINWLITTIDDNIKIPVTIAKTEITVAEMQEPKAIKFDGVDFERLTKQQDTLFNKKNKALMAISKKDGDIVFKTLEKSAYDKITFTINNEIIDNKE